MTRIILTITASIVGLSQSLSFPWLNLLGNPVPLLLAVLFLCAPKFGKQLPVMGIAGGLALDLVSPTPFGLWTLYYFCAGFILRLLLDKQNASWWWSLVWLSAAIALNPLYAQAMAGQLNLAHWIHEIIGPTIIIVAIAAWPSWLLRKPTEHGI